MSKHLPVPPELEHLIEKRDTEADRRKARRRAERDSSGDGSAGGTERRQKPDRRGKPRRKSDRA